METLKFLLQSKKADSNRTKEVVTDAVVWMQTQLQNAGIAVDYAEGGANFGLYGHFQIKPLVQDSTLTLHIKIAEINGRAYASAEVKDEQQETLFRYFGEMEGEENKLKLLHYIADFELSTSPGLAEASD